jgi:hypothetical protein
MEGIMLVMLMKEQLLSPRQVCANCLLADADGQPRWQQGRLRCGRASAPEPSQPQLPQQFECQMGFRVALIPGE